MQRKFISCSCKKSLFLWRKWHMLFLLELTALFQNADTSFKWWCIGRDHCALCGFWIGSFLKINITTASSLHFNAPDVWMFWSVQCARGHALAPNVTGYQQCSDFDSNYYRMKRIILICHSAEILNWPIRILKCPIGHELSCHVLKCIAVVWRMKLWSVRS